MQNNLIKKKRSKNASYVQEHWMEDEFFTYQFLNGINPMMIKQCFNIPENFPVTEDMLQVASLRPVSLAEELQKGNLVLVDYHRLDGLAANVINDKQQYLAAPLVLLYLTPEDQLIPMAIQLKKPEDDNPIFLPADSQYDWLMAKIFVRAADFLDHELNFHLLRTHLLSEVFAVATLRNFPMVHPLHKLLNGHFRYTLQINALARAQLISEKGFFNEYTAVGGPAMMQYLQKAVTSLTCSALCMPEDITAHGLDKVPNFYYRDDGLKLWDTIHSYVKGVVEYYYTCNAEVRDTELQSWINDIFVFGFLSMTETGIARSFSSVTDLIKFLTMVIFTASVQHATVNSGQFDYYGWMPNGPLSLQQSPPMTKGKCTESTMMATLPDINVTVHGLATVYLLSKPSTDYVSTKRFTLPDSNIFVFM
ncbi:LOW QUALITY PROTEIN: hydroperoxide isomerase ALOXE3-like [Aplochiton taeniatus]